MERTWHKWTKDEENYLRDNFENLTCQQFADHFNVSVNAVKRKRTDLGIKKSKEALRRIYSKPNPGQFKGGSLPKNTLTDSAITVRIDKKGTAYKWIRVSLAKWEMLHRHIWLKAGRLIPAGYVLAFIDKNPLNCVLENLELLTRSENLQRNRNVYLVHCSSKALTKRQEYERTKQLKKAERIENVDAKKFAAKQKKKAEREAKKLAILLEIGAEREAKRLASDLKREEERLAKKLAKKQENKPKKSAKKVKIPKEKKIISKKVKVAKLLIPVKRQEKQYQTKVIDYSQLRLIKIDNKTSIWVNPGDDVEAIKKRYQKKI